VKEFFKSLFGASTKEVMGFSVLILILIIGVLVPRAVGYFTPQDDSHWLKDEQLLDSLVLILEAEKSHQQGREVAQTAEPYIFNPNQASLAELQRLGFDETIANRIVNYRNSGASFRTRDDLYKIYNIDSALVNELYNYIDLPEEIVKDMPGIVLTKEPPKEPQVKAKREPADLPAFDINLADTAMLQTINGIGSVLSQRIITFRDKLKGFVDVNQLYEVYNLDSMVAAALIDKIYIADNYSPQKLRINRANEVELAGHPYISRQQARLIVAYRRQHGDFRNQQDLLKVYAIGESDIKRLARYIDWSPSL
jgi:competence protein ComEA